MNRGHTGGSSAESPRLLHTCATHPQLSLPRAAHPVGSKVGKHERCRKRKANYTFRGWWLLQGGWGTEGRTCWGCSCSISCIGLPHCPAATSMPKAMWGQWGLQPKQFRCLLRSEGDGGTGGRRDRSRLAQGDGIRGAAGTTCSTWFVRRALLVCCERPKKRIIQEPVRRPMTFIKY